MTTLHVSPKRPVYLDYAATTPVDDAFADADHDHDDHAGHNH